MGGFRTFWLGHARPVACLDLSGGMQGRDAAHSPGLGMPFIKMGNIGRSSQAGFVLGEGSGQEPLSGESTCLIVH